MPPDGAADGDKRLSQQSESSLQWGNYFTDQHREDEKMAHIVLNKISVTLSLPHLPF